MNDVRVAEAAESFIRRATGFDAPYPWQVRVALEGLPETLEIPTGCGKTAGVTLGWLFRRREHPDVAVRSATPRRLVIVLPLRSLVEQTQQFVLDWLGRLGLTDSGGNGEVTVATLLGGERGNEAWRTELQRDAVVVGTQDMVLSRALNRGYAANRFLWPVEFGLLNNDCHFVFDEVQLMGAGLPTSRQLHALRGSLGVTGSVGSTWMSATLDRERLATVDAPDVAEPFMLGEGDHSDELSCRLSAPRTFQRWLPGGAEPRKLSRERAAAVLSAHKAATRTLVVVNTVRAARDLHAELVRAKPDAELRRRAPLRLGLAGVLDQCLDRLPALRRRAPLRRERRLSEPSDQPRSPGASAPGSIAACRTRRRRGRRLSRSPGASAPGSIAATGACTSASTCGALSACASAPGSTTNRWTCGSVASVPSSHDNESFRRPKHSGRPPLLGGRRARDSWQRALGECPRAAGSCHTSPVHLFA